MRWAAVAVLGALALRPALARAEVPRTQRVLDVGIHEGVPWPIIPAPIDGPLPPAPSTAEPPPPAPTRAGHRVVDVVEHIRTSLRASIYQPSTRVSEKDGLYHWDCSGMAAWILRRAAPVALRTLNSSRPVARDFVTAIERAPEQRPRRGWQQIARVADVMPGDVFAWRRPRGLPSKNTGHVGFVVDRPLPVDGIPGAWAVRIVDSTRGSHQDDARSDDPDGGFGIGTLVFLTNAEGRATSYGWAGTQSEWYIVTPIVFGRVDR
jgi:hypothetical protein